MRTLLLAVSLSLLLTGPAFAQEPPPAMPEPLPPPDIDEPGVRTDPTEVDPDALPDKVRPPDEVIPEVTIRTDADTGDVVEEYRQNGVVYMVRVRPPRGPEYLLLDTNGDGRLDASDGEGPVRPVYWTIYEWE